ncbi:MAG: glycosyltransferase family 2 protein, partial [Treponema sp.]|nr:glycosyltransferase family 2 protein [Treponema sp.]
MLFPSIYKNIEFIIVDDKSPGNVAEIVERYGDSPRIRFVQNAENLGLFHARLAGAAVATGDYLVFIDADDHVSVDYYRTLIKKAEETDSDLVLGNFVNEYDEPSLHYSLRKTSKIRRNNFDLHGDEIKDLFFTSRGMEPEVVQM